MQIEKISELITLKTLNYTPWGLTVIGDEVFIATYSSSPYRIEVYSASIFELLRSFTVTGVTPNSYGSIGTDGNNLYVCNSANRLVSVDKTNGSVLSIRNDTTYNTDRGATFDIDLERDIMVYSRYGTVANNLVICRFSDGAILNTYTMPMQGTGASATIYKSRGASYIIVTQYSTRDIFISSDISNGYGNLTFSSLYSYVANNLAGVGLYKNTLYFANYYDRRISKFDITKLTISKMLLRNGQEYYYYSNSQWVSLGSNPTREQIITHGMESITASQISEFEALYGLTWYPIRWADEEDSSETGTLNATPYPQILTAKNSIQLTGVVSCTFQWTATGGSRLALSVDDGVTYHAFKNGIWVNVANDMSNAMTVTEYTAMTWEQYRLLAGDSNFLKHQYYIPNNSTIDDTLITAELMGTNKLANTSDYSVAYDQSKKTITINIKKSGTFFANVLDT